MRDDLRDPELLALLERSTVRPGELREWVQIGDGRHWSSLQARAEAQGLGLECAAMLAIEQWLVARDLPQGRAVAARLRTAAESARIQQPLPAAVRRYLATLLHGRPLDPQPIPSGLPVPVRLLRRLTPDTLRQALAEGDVTEGVCWEIAAVACGLSMGEWVWRTLAAVDQPTR